MKVDAADRARTSIADFYQQYKNLIFKKADEMANDPDCVEDLVQDTLYKLLRREELFLSLSETQQVDYCIKTVRNTAIIHHKRNQKNRFLSKDAIDGRSNPSSSDLIRNNQLQPLPQKTSTAEVFLFRFDFPDFIHCKMLTDLMVTSSRGW